jgi:hypothetical protein
MKKKNIILGILLLFAMVLGCTVFASLPSLAAGTTYYVAASGSDTYR